MIRSVLLGSIIRQNAEPDACVPSNTCGNDPHGLRRAGAMVLRPMQHEMSPIQGEEWGSISPHEVWMPEEVVTF